MLVRNPARPTVRALLALLLTITGVAVVALPVRPAAAAPAAAPTISYAALGDSYSSGVGAPPYDSSGCSRSQRSYPPLWVAARGAVTTFRFVACGGAETADVLANQITALDAGTDLVSITIGGNDAGFADIMITCQFGSEAACSSAVAGARAFMTGELPGRLDRTYAAIDARAPTARLVVLGYPRLFELTSSCGLLGMSRAKRTQLNGAADLLAQVIADRAAAAGAVFVDTRPVFAGHGLCGSSPWITGIASLFDAFHPNASGYRSGYLPALTSAAG
jgi:lysophospholipase L1-like esterase